MSGPSCYELHSVLDWLKWHIIDMRVVSSNFRSFVPFWIEMAHHTLWKEKDVGSAFVSSYCDKDCAQN